MPLLCSKLHVLLVEDNNFTSEVLSSLLSEHRMTVSCAATGEQALQMVGIHDLVSAEGSRKSLFKHTDVSYDVIIMDLSLIHI